MNGKYDFCVLVTNFHSPSSIVITYFFNDLPFKWTHHEEDSYIAMNKKGRLKPFEKYYTNVFVRLSSIILAEMLAGFRGTDVCAVSNVF